MSGPWDQYAQPPPAQSDNAGPWNQYQPPPDMSAVKDYVAKNLAAVQNDQESKPAQDQPQKSVANGFFDALDVGWQNSISGLEFTHRALPDKILPEHAGTAMRIASQIGQMAGDAPAMIAGFIGGGGPASPVTATAGAFAAPAALRKILMDHYEKGDIQSASDFVERAMGASWEAIKGGTTGALTALTGGMAEPFGLTAKLGTELVTMTTVSKALEGKLPDAQDFVDGAIMLGGFHGVSEIAPKLRNIYAQTGMRPEDVVQEAQKDPSILQDVVSSNVEVPKAFGPEQLPESTPAENIKTEGNDNFQPHATTDEDVSQEIPSKVTVPSDTEEKTLPQGEPEDVSAAREAIRSRIGEQTESTQPFKEWASSTWNKFYQNYFDSLSPIAKGLKESGQENLPASENPYTLGRTYAAYLDKVRNFFESGTIDFKTQKENGEGLKSILSGADLDRFRDYWVSRRALDLNARGIETGIDNGAAQKIVDADEKEFQPIVDRIVDYKNRVLKYYADSGMVSQDTYNKMVSQNQNHASFYRILDPDENGKPQGKGQLIKTINGSTEQIQDPIYSTFLDTERLVRAADKNNIVQKAVAALGDHFEAAPGSLKPITISDEELVAEMKRQGIDANPDSMQVFRKQYQPLQDGQIAFYEDGKRIVKNTSQDMADAINSLGSNPGVDNLFVKMARPFAQIARLGTTLNPAFALRHVVRAQFFAGVFSDAGQIPFIDALKTVSKSPEDMELMKQWLIDGGAQGSLEKLDKTYFENDLLKLNNEAPFISRAWNYVKTKAEMAEVFIRAADNANRFAEYKKSLEGIDNPTLDQRKAAALSSRNVGIDYSRSGAKMSAIAQMSAFFNAKMQGLDLMARRFNDDPVGFSMKAAAFVTIPTILNWASNHDDPRYQEAPEWQKNLYWVVPIDHWREATPQEASIYDASMKRQRPDGTYEVNDGPTFRIPKPPGLGQLFGSVPEAILNKYKNHDPSAIKGLATSLMDESPPIPVPNAIMPVVEQMTNHSFFTGNPLIPSSRENLVPELQYTPYTSDTARALGKMIAAVPGLRSLGPENKTLESPLVIQNYINAWGGGVGRYAVWIADTGLEKLGIYPDTSPEQKISDMPFAREFMVRYPDAKAQSIETFMERAKQLDSLTASEKFLAKSGDIQGAQNFLQMHPEYGSYLVGIKNGINAQSHVIQSVMQNTSISKTQKRQLMDGVYNQMIQAAKMGNQLFDQMDASRNQH